MLSFWRALKDWWQAPPITIGDTVVVSRWEWVTILNVNPIRNENITYEYGDNAGIEPDGRLTVLNVEDDLLVQYSPPRGKKPAGTRCPNGALIRISMVRYLSMHVERVALLKDQASVKRRLIESLKVLIA